MNNACMEGRALLGLVIQYLIQLIQPRIISLDLRMQKGDSTLLLSHYINIRTCVNNEHCYEKIGSEGTCPVLKNIEPIVEKCRICSWFMGPYSGNGHLNDDA